MKIVVLDGYTLNPGDLSWQALEELGELVVYDRTENIPSVITKAIDGAEIIFTNKTIIPKEVVAQNPQLKFIGVLATGYNVIDIEACKANGIIVANVPTYSTQAVAQFTFALILELCHHVGAHDQAVKNNKWTSMADFCFWDYPLIELEGKTLGVIGFGSIGQATAKIAQAFGMRILVYNRSLKEVSGIEYKQVELEELLREADFVSLHAPLTEATNQLINKNTISKMKDGAKLINTGRGQLINEQDVFEALESGKLSGAALDVVSKEPIEATNPLLKAKNCIITPHIAWASKESRQRLMNTAVENLKGFLEENPKNVVT